MAPRIEYENASPHVPSKDALAYVAHRLDITSFRHDPSWYNEEYYPRPRPKQIRSSEKVRNKLVQENHDRSGLHPIPNELLQTISTHLDGADFMSLRASCRDMRGRVQPGINEHDPRTTRDDCIDFAVRLHVDRFAKMAQVEKTTRRAKSNVLCSFCLLAHPRNAFKPELLKRPAYLRQCIGAGAIFHACVHRSFNFMQLKAEMKHGVSQNDGKFGIATSLCKELSHASQDLSIGNDVRLTLDRVTNGVCVLGGIGLGKYHVYGERTSHDSSLQQRVQSDLAMKGKYMCPHLRASDIHAWEHTIQDWVTNACFRLRESGDRHRLSKARGRRNGFCIRKHSCCAEPNCSTSLGYFCSSHDLRTPLAEPLECELNVKVWRHLGTLESVMDPRWIAQTEEV